MKPLQDTRLKMMLIWTRMVEVKPEESILIEVTLSRQN